MAFGRALTPASGGLDRDAATRMDDTALDTAWNEPDARVLWIGSGGRLPFIQYEDRLALGLVQVRGERSAQYLYLGRAGGAPLFCSSAEMAAAEGVSCPEPSGGWQHPFVVSDALSPLEIEIMTVALALTNWHESMPRSARDGELTTIAQGGWARVDALGGEHFPRTDPAVIVLIEHKNSILLGSNLLWETGRFSLLAGFVEAGESAEEAVIREVQEEAGVPLERVRYVASQAWPFTRSLMLGFRASLAAGADPEALCPDPTEISELRWFSRDELRDPSADLKLPGKLSIARTLIDLWVAEDDSEQ